MDNFTIFGWYFTIAMPSPLWVWVGIVLAFIAVVVAIMTLPTVLQMIYGKPKLVLYFRNFASLGLALRIQNMPLNTFQKFLRVKRESIDDFSLRIYISSHDKEVIESTLDGYIYGDSTGRLLTFNDIQRNHISLPASFYQASTLVVRAGEQYGKHTTRIYDMNGNYDKELAEGSYSLHIEICADGQIAEIYKDFKVNNHEPWVEWDKGEGKVSIELRDDEKYVQTQDS